MCKTVVICRARKAARMLAQLGLALVLIVFSYAVVGMLLSLVTLNRNPVPGNDVKVYLVDNGVHTDIVVPTTTARIDWSEVVLPVDTKARVKGSYLSFGWGSQDFYLNFPSWSDVLRHPLRTLCIIPRAISGVGDTALHITYVNEPSVGEDCRRLMLSAAQYDALVQHIFASGKRNDDGTFVRIPHDGYGRYDVFYEGVGCYSPFFTCNTWANSALKACGQRCCLWTALSFPIFWKYPLESSLKEAER